MAFLAVSCLLRGTGGSALIIGSAAGVAVMGLERIDFVWYLKKISLLAVLGVLRRCRSVHADVCVTSPLPAPGRCEPTALNN